MTPDRKGITRLALLSVNEKPTTLPPLMSALFPNSLRPVESWL